jgi:hypothetical protein
MTEPRTLTGDEFAEAQTVLAPAFTSAGPAPEFDLRVIRACWVFADALRRPPDPRRDEAAKDRAALLLLNGPDDAAGTPYRCTRCRMAYYSGPDPADWLVAGAETWVCWVCATSPPKPAPLAIEAPKPPRARKAAARKPAAIIAPAADGAPDDGG